MNKIRSNQFKQKSLGLSMWLNVTLLLAAALVLFAIPATAIADENASEAKAAPCKGLKPYNNLDELLYQFYINLDSNCLFKMKAADLETIWGIKILSEDRRKPSAYYPLSETEFYNKLYESERDAFYIEIAPRENDKQENVFLIKITKYYYNAYGTLFPLGVPPKLITEDLVKDFSRPNKHLWKPGQNTHFWASDHFAIGFTVDDPSKVTEIKIIIYIL